MSTPISYYNLIATLGFSPAVITETVWSYANDREGPRHPLAIHIVTTAAAHAKWAQVMEGGVWETFCEQFLEQELVPQITVPTCPNGEPLTDITSYTDDWLAYRAIWRHVYALTRPGRPPLVGSLAGGRRTMGNRLQNAFERLGRASDELVHVLVPAAYERNPSFFYPTVPEDYVAVSRLKLDYVKKRAPYERDVLRRVAVPSDLNQVHEEERRQEHRRPARIRLYLGQISGLPKSGSIAEFLDEDEEVLESCQLSPRDASTLLVLTEQIMRRSDEEAGTGRVENVALLSQEVDEQRRLVWDLTMANPGKPFVRTEDFADLQTTEQEQLMRRVQDGRLEDLDEEQRALAEKARQKGLDRISRVVSDLRTDKSLPQVALDYLTFESHQENRRTYYRYTTTPPVPLDVIVDKDTHEFLLRRNRRSTGDLFQHVLFRQEETSPENPLDG